MSRVARFRRTDRHLVSSRGQAVSLDGFRLVGERFLDASAEGVLLACDERVELGEPVLVSFPLPGSDLVFDAETEVVRIVRGERPGDPGYCAGLRFTSFDRRARRPHRGAQGDAGRTGPCRQDGRAGPDVGGDRP